jgi:hypothetical protein
MIWVPLLELAALATQLKPTKFAMAVELGGRGSFSKHETK